MGSVDMLDISGHSEAWSLRILLNVRVGQPLARFQGLPELCEDSLR